MPAALEYLDGGTLRDRRPRLPGRRPGRPRGDKFSEDVAVPLDRLGDAIRGTLEIGARHALQVVSWGHAGDGILHSSFLVAPGDEAELERAERAAEELFELALGGTVSGEHGLGALKRGHAGPAPRVEQLQRAIKAAFDPRAC